MTFDDDYPSCVSTYATLRVFSINLAPTAIGDALNLQPSEYFSKGDLYGRNKLTRRETGWFLSTRETVNSRDARRHIAWILEQLATKVHSIKKLRQDGAEIDISCYYVSTGEGGPTMSSEQMFELGGLGLDLWWDIYFENSPKDQ